MGCGASKIDDTPLIVLCRERRSLIRDAADRRFSLAAAHSDYLRSVAGVGDAIQRFVQEELVAAPSPPSSPVIALPRESKSKSDSSATPLSHSLSLDDDGSHLHLSSESGSERSLKSSPQISPNSSFMRSSTAIPTMVYQNPSDWGYAYNYPIGSPPREPAAEITPPPPAAEGGSAWDFFNPFNSYEQGKYSGYYGVSSASSSTNSSEVRRREGIPDLEDETQQDTLEKGKKVMDFGEGTSRSVPEEDIAKSIDSEHEKESISISGRSKESSIKENEGQAKDEGVTLEEESRASNVNLASANGNRDIMEVVIETKKLFQSAADCGEEVSRMLEVGKLNHRSRSRISRVVSSRIWEPMGLSILSTRPFKHSQSSATRPATRPTKNRNNPAVSENRIGIKPGNLSSTLEKLYVWEKKLYKEVKDEERLRSIYEKKWRRLRRLDNRGAESNKIDSTRASIKQLQLKLSIVIRSVDTISSRIHKIRDDELRPQLVELIKRLIKMWKSMLECHRKQLQAILDSKTHNLRAKTGVHGHIVANATKELEIQLVNWCSCFYNWTSIQKSYVEALNGWLMKWLPQEEEETEDGVLPFSPSRIEAPVVFVVSNDWSNALLRVSESDVMTAMHNFAVHVHNLWESQYEEQRRKLKAEFLSRDYDQRLNTLKKDGRIQGNNLDVVSATNDGLVYQDDTMKALELARKRLEEERTKHREIAKQVQEAASSTLKTGLLPVFEALRGFISETVDAYKELRIPKEGDGGP